jgi:L-aspartate oxidase
MKPIMDEMANYDFVVIGSGIAGLTFALNVADAGTVALVTKKERSESNTNYAQGGIAAAVGATDSWEFHYQDTLVAGAGLCHHDAVEALVKEGPDLIKWLQTQGANFDVTDGPDPHFLLGREGGHRQNRIVHHADKTGWESERTLLSSLKSRPNITVFEHFFALDLAITEGECIGVHLLDTHSGQIVQFGAKAVALATGGCGQAYLYTTNPPIATGDGVAMARRAGATIANMEFIQFHPTTLYHNEARSFLISEAVRGEGGLLIRKNGERFMDAYHSMAELAPRDIVARAIDAELKEHNEECVYLDITHLASDFIQKRFPSIYKRCLSVGLDITKEPIPVVPAAHYSCGGVVTDLNGRTNLPRLYACGEVSCTGVHGANRLASNSLLEALVFGERAAKDALNWLQKPAPVKATPLPQASAHKIDNTAVFKFRKQIQEIMWSQVGIVRTNERLVQAQRELDALAIEALPLLQSPTPTADSAEIRNLFDVANMIIECAINRKESRGLHYTLDYPDKDDERFLKDTILAPQVKIECNRP